MAKLNEIFIKSFSGEWGAEDLDGTGTPVLRTTNFTNHGVINYTDVVTRNIKKKNISDKYLSKGDIIIEKSGGSDKQPVGRVVFFDGEEGKYLFNNFTGLLRVKNKDEWLPRYVFYALFANYCVGGTRRYENRTTGLHNLQLDAYLSGTEIKKRNYEIQIEIVNNLDKVSELIGRFKEQLQDIDLLIKSRFIELFGDPVSNPKNWAKKAIKEFATDVRYGTSKPAIEGGRYPYLRMNNLTYDGRLDLSDLKYIDIPDNELEKCVVKYGDILFNRTNSIELVGKTCLFEFNYPMVIAGYIIRIRLNDRVTPLYLTTYMNLEFMKKQLRNMAKGAVNQANINAQEMQSIIVPVPPLDLQNQFADFVEEVNKSKFTHCYELLLLIIKKIWYNNYV